ncbi:MAG: hypothetical protein AAB739_01400 [Patescibacteria group bacterium]
MINLNYKKYIGYFLAGIVGILFIIGLRSASAANPTDLSSSNVNPNFNQVYVTDTLQSKTANVSGDLAVLGSANLAGNIYAMGNIENSNGSVVINDDLVVKNGVNIQEALEVADVVASGDIDMGGDLQVSKTIEAGGELRAKGGIVNPSGDVKINDAFNIDDEFYTGSDISGITPAKGYYTILDRLLAYGVAVFKGSVTFQNDADVKGGLTVGGSAKATGKLSTDSDLIAGGKLGVSGDSVLNGTLKNNASTIKVYDASGVLKEQLTPAPVYIDDDMKVWGNLTSKGAFEAKGKALFSGDTEFSKTLLVPGGIENSAGDVLINDALDVRKGIFNNDGTSLVKFGGASKPMNLQVTGTIKSNGGIGTYSYPSSTVNMKAGFTGTGIASTYCGKSSDILLSCYFSASNKDMKVYALDKTVSGGLKGCYINFNNPTSISQAQSVTVSGICFNSTY